MSSPLTTQNHQDGHKTLHRAIEVANRVHRAQGVKIGEGWYIAHPLHLSILLSQCGFSVAEQDDLDVLVAAILHDGPEDRPKEITLDQVQGMFRLRVRQLVEVVTLHPTQPDPRGDRAKIIGLGWQEQSVKMADVASNSIRIASAVRQFGLVQVQKFLRQPLMERFEMELGFVSSCLSSGTDGPEHAKRLRYLTLGALQEMKYAVTAAP